MPRKSDTIKIAGSNYDRRIKIKDKDFPKILQLYNSGMSLRALGKMFGVDKKAIKRVTHPEEYKKTLAKNAERLRENNTYKRYPGNHTKAIREHRNYKRKLYLEGKIKLDSGEKKINECSKRNV